MNTALRPTTRGPAALVRLAVVSLAATGLVALGTPAYAADTATVSGTVTFPAGVSLTSDYTFVGLVDPETGWAGGVDSVEADGSYTIEDVAAGTYKLEVRSYNEAVPLSTWWGGAYELATAQSFTVSDGETVSKNVTVPRGATISGKAVDSLKRPGAGSVATAYRANNDGSWTYYNSVGVETNGAYTIGQLSPGSYRVKFDRARGCGFGCVSEGLEYWPDKFTLADAQTITLTVGAVRAGIDADFATINGHSTAVTLAGTLAVGSTLTVNTKTASWAPDSTLEYTWFADNQLLAGQTGRTLTLTSAQAGKSIKASVFREVEEDEYERRESATSVKVATTGTPVVSGTAAVGRKLTANPGLWTSGTTFTYRWLADGKSISKATKPSYTLTAAEKGKRITVSVTGSKPGHATVAKTSKPTATVKAGILAASVPKISGTLKVGKKLTAKPGTWTSGTSLSYRWYASGKPISGATKSTLTLKSAQKGRTITVKVTGKKSGYSTATKTSSATKKVG